MKKENELVPENPFQEVSWETLQSSVALLNERTEPEEEKILALHKKVQALKKKFCEEIATINTVKAHRTPLNSATLTKKCYERLRILFSSCTLDSLKILAFSYPSQEDFFEAINLDKEDYSKAISTYITYVRSVVGSNAKTNELMPVAAILNANYVERKNWYLENFVPQSLYNIDPSAYITCCIEAIKAWGKKDQGTYITEYFASLAAEDLEMFVSKCKARNINFFQHFNIDRDDLGHAIQKTHKDFYLNRFKKLFPKTPKPHADKKKKTALRQEAKKIFQPIYEQNKYDKREHILFPDSTMKKIHTEEHQTITEEISSVSKGSQGN